MKSLKRMAIFAQPYWLVAFLLLITVVLPVAMELTVPRLLRFIIDAGIEAGNMEAIIQGSVLMLVASLIGVVATLGQGVCRALLSQGLAFNMRNALFAHIQTFSFANLDKLQTGQLMTRLSSDVDIVKMFLGSGIALILRFFLMVLGSYVFMFIIDWQLAVISLTLIPIAALLIWFVLRLAQPIYVVVQQYLGTINTIVQENLAGVQVVKAFVREPYEIERFEGANNSYMNQHIKVGRLLAVTMPSLMLLTNLGIILIVWFGGLSTIDGRLTIGQFVAFTNYLLIGMAPLLVLSNMLSLVPRAETSAERVFEVLDMNSIVEPPRTPIPNKIIKGDVSFSNVTFHYGNGQNVTVYPPIKDSNLAGGQDVLNGISFKVKAGERVALLGATGSGKSSLVNLLPRFYDPDDGRIEVDGNNVRDWDLETLRSNIGMVLQQTTLFSGTIRENITFGADNATFAEIQEAAKAAQAHNFILEMPDGYDSLVVERGANLSGGQKQRIAIARALLIQPGILILDDSTSAVDLETEALIQEALEKLMEGKTTFIVAQRINSVLNADRILVLDKGRLVAQGNHQQLLAKNSIYQEIFNSQLGNGSTPAGIPRGKQS